MIWRMLKENKKRLTAQQYRTIKGQMVAGDVDGALKGMSRCIRRNMRHSETK